MSALLELCATFSVLELQEEGEPLADFEDKLFWSCVAYTLFVLIVFSFLPASFISGQPDVTRSASSIVNPENATQYTLGSSSVGFFGKVAILYFATWNIEDFPVLFAVLVSTINWVSTLVIVVYGFNKATQLIP